METTLKTVFNVDLFAIEDLCEDFARCLSLSVEKIKKPGDFCGDMRPTI